MWDERFVYPYIIENII